MERSKRTYIVHMDKSSMPHDFTHHSLWYDSSLKSVSKSAPMLYTYENVIHGYSTRLTVEEAELLRKQHGILFVIPEVRYELHRTRTPEFLGLTQHSARFPISASMSDVIVGVLDTGVWPELKIFDIPSLVRCLHGGKAVELKSPRDDEGHGTHTATTAAGSVVPDANFLGSHGQSYHRWSRYSVDVDLWWTIGVLS
ncbi:NADH dehydrogenase [Hibiscus syriacus]|uniref:NADH dehydrogenase n=1 Tax=Hibiscus syriacus TaxID=106335 RepID=A0A6A2WJ25_HIBSY|nr:NADH dehydrogenase [Hibiscus syriacus]